MRKLIVIAVLCAACSSTTATSTTPPPPPSGTLIGPAGGTVTSADGHAVLNFPPGALTTPITITTALMTDAPASAALVPSRAYDFGPSGTQFNQPVTVTVGYDPAQLPIGVLPLFLRLYVRNGAGWDSIPGSTVDTLAHTVTGTTKHFSGFTPCGPSCTFGGFAPVVAANFVPNCCVVLTQGGSGSATAMVFVSNYGGGVGFTLANPPAGVTMSYALGPPTGTCSVTCGMVLTMTFSAAATAPVGRVNLDVEPVVGSGVYTAANFPVPAEILPTPAVTIGLSSASLAIAQSGTATSAVTLTRINFSAPITLSAINLPSGVTALFNPAQLTGTSLTSVLTLTASSSATAGTSNIIVRGTASGLANVDVTIPLTVASFAISGTPAAVSLAPGATGNTGVKVTRGNGFSGTITYAVSGLPAGLTASVRPTGVADSSQFSVTASASVTPGSYPIVVTATSGAIVQEVTIAVTVAASGSGGTHLDWSACQYRPVWVAYQDGSGTWTRLTGTGDVYTVPTINSTNAGIAFVLPNPGGAFTTVTNFMTKAELSVLPPRCASSTGATNATVTVTGIPDTSSDVAWLSAGAASVATKKPGTFSISNITPGVHDLVGYMQAPTGDRVTIQRGVNGGNIDFGAASKPDSAMMTVNGNSGRSMAAEMLYITRSCEAGVMYVTNPTVSPFPFTGMPAALQAASDVHAFGITDFGASSIRSVTTYFHAVGNSTVTLGAAIAPTFSNLAGTYKRTQAAFALPSDYGYVDLQLTSTTSRSVSLVSQTGGYIGTGNVTIVVPDFSAVAGFNTSWELQASGATTYLLEATAGSPFTAPACAAGTVTKKTYLVGTAP